MWSSIWVVGLGGFVGANLRYWLSVWLAQRIPFFPAGTLAVNVIGSLLLGLIAGSAGGLGPSGRLLLGTGVMGAFTTFSTFSVETLQLLQDAHYAAAALNVAANLLVGFGAAWLGLTLARGLGAG
ncbi:MAG TPA: fluoride efflux transporter CrcB [Limnochordia bacterium]|nr:fluoride efflux transporter CrcB [Limnochordia bacterium]